MTFQKRGDVKPIGKPIKVADMEKEKGKKKSDKKKK